jgi:EAL domain-containing protein (putative c-di-GMP-specific phosphodiesterase class I)
LGILPLHLGAVHETSVTLDSQLLSRADAALRIAQHQGDGYWYLQPNEIASVRPAGEWRHLLQAVLEKGELVLHFQPVFDRQKRLLHAEVLVRMNIDGQLQSAGSFLPMVERFLLVEQLDKCVLQLVAQQFKRAPVDYCVNLSPKTVAQPQFCEWLRSFLLQHTDLAQHLILEVSENVVVTHAEALQSLVGVANGAGAKISLDHFGVTGRAFNYLQSLPLQSLKIDRSFIAGVDGRQDNQFFIKSLVQIAHSCDMMLLAEGVESESEWEMLQSLGLDGGQGYYLARPSADLPTS